MLFIHIEQYPSIHDDGHDSIRVSHVAYICMSFSLTACPTKNGQYEYLYMVCRAKCDGTDKRQMHFYFMVTRISMNLNGVGHMAIWTKTHTVSTRSKHMYIVYCTVYTFSVLTRREIFIVSIASEVRMQHPNNILVRKKNNIESSNGQKIRRQTQMYENLFDAISSLCVCFLH